MKSHVINTTAEALKAITDAYVQAFPDTPDHMGLGEIALHVSQIIADHSTNAEPAKDAGQINELAVEVFAVKGAVAWMDEKGSVCSKAFKEGNPNVKYAARFSIPLCRCDAPAQPDAPFDKTVLTAISHKLDQGYPELTNSDVYTLLDVLTHLTRCAGCDLCDKANSVHVANPAAGEPPDAEGKS